MKILAIETSCDDTGIAIVEMNNHSITILSNIVNTQTIHAGYGGVFPAMAKREHINNIEGVYEDACKEAGLDKDNLKVDAIAVTVGPGLEPSLWVGVTFAKELAEKFKLPIIGVNHMEGHLLSALLPKYELKTNLQLKALPENSICLLVSGGHTQIVHIEKLGKYKILGTTLDDAVGEAFDKVARMLGLTYPGGPAVSKLAELERSTGNSLSSEPPIFPRPMLHSKNYNFSFSGLKTAVLYYIRDLIKDKKDNPSEKQKQEIARAFEDAAIEVIIKKVSRAIEEYGATYLLLGGGVACNTHLLREFKKQSEKQNFEIYEPVKQITGDNALMIAIASYFNQKNSHLLKANGNLSF